MPDSRHHTEEAEIVPDYWYQKLRIQGIRFVDGSAK
jgi:hypothetical protein